MPAFHLLFISSLLAFLTIQSNAAQNVTLQLTSPEITYLPFLCGNSTLDYSTTPTGSCAGGWQLLDYYSAGPIVGTNGPDPQTGSIIPQLFVNFHAMAVYLMTSPSSNATANMTASFTPSASVLSIQLNSSITLAAFVNLNEADLTSLAVTFIPSNASSQLLIDCIIITVSEANATSLFLPSQTLPPPTPLTFTIQSATFASNITSPTSTPQAQRHVSKKELEEAFALVLGIGLGLTPIAAVVFIFWKRRKRRKRTKI